MLKKMVSVRLDASDCATLTRIRRPGESAGRAIARLIHAEAERLAIEGQGAMIHINDTWELERAAYDGWTLWKSTPTTNPATGAPTVKRKPLHYGQLAHALRHVLEDGAGAEADTLEAVLAGLDRTQAQIMAAFGAAAETLAKSARAEDFGGLE